MKEEWRPIPDFEGLYEVSDQGRVRSLARSGRYHRKSDRILSPSRLPAGYLSLLLCDKVRGLEVRRYVHDLVLTVFIGPRPAGTEACHFPNRDPSDCRAVNLRWDTRRNNHADKRAHGTDARGEKHPHAKLSERDVIRMRKLRNNTGLAFHRIAAKFGVTTMTAFRACSGQCWGHIEEGRK